MRCFRAAISSSSMSSEGEEFGATDVSDRVRVRRVEGTPVDLGDTGARGVVGRSL